MNQARYGAYFAAPLFSEAEREFNARAVLQLEELFTVYLPQRDGRLVSAMVEQGISAEQASSDVFARDLDAIESSDYLVAVLDGRAIDEGVAFELGVAYSRGKICLGLQTDPRRLAPWGNNPMIAGALRARFDSVGELVAWFRARSATTRPQPRRTPVRT